MAGRSRLIGLVLIAGAGVAIGGLWATVKPTAEHSRALAEIARLRKSEGDQRPVTAAPTSPPLCQALTATRMGRVTDTDLSELSGLVFSRRRSDLLWGIEDSGAQPVLSALRTNGTLAGNWTVPGAKNVDWEDIAAGPSPSGPVLYAADIGDNNAVRKDGITIYRVPEPVYAVGGGQTAAPARLHLTYPDGPHDAETLLIDPRRGTLVIVTKGITGGNAYALSPPLPFGGSAVLHRVGPINVPTPTAGDVSRDGRTIAIRGYFSISVWKRRGNEPITTTLRRTACTSPTAMNDGQGESLALRPDGSSAWTVSEGNEPPLIRLSAATR